MRFHFMCICRFALHFVGIAAAMQFEIIGGRTRIRTLDPLIKSQLLYQLSYAPGSWGKPNLTKARFIALGAVLSSPFRSCLPKHPSSFPDNEEACLGQTAPQGRPCLGRCRQPFGLAWAAIGHCFGPEPLPGRPQGDIALDGIVKSKASLSNTQNLEKLNFACGSVLWLIQSGGFVGPFSQPLSPRRLRNR